MRGEARRRVGWGFGWRLGEQVLLVGVPLGVAGLLVLAADWFRHLDVWHAGTVRAPFGGAPR
jgi:hypothetical protein